MLTDANQTRIETDSYLCARLGVVNPPALASGLTEDRDKPPRRSRAATPATLVLTLAALLALLSGCSSTSSPPSLVPGKLQVVAAENFWGSIAAQLGGE